MTTGFLRVPTGNDVHKGGNHSEGAWKKRLPDALRFVFGSQK